MSNTKIEIIFLSREVIYSLLPASNGHNSFGSLEVEGGNPHL
jgi:hypothetical protein